MSPEPYNYNKIAGKRVVIFGGTSGIGLAVAKATLYASGIVIVASSSPARIESTIQKLTSQFPGAQVSGHVCDLSLDTVEEEIEGVFDKIGGKVDHIVYSAGDPLPIMPLQDVSRENIIAAGQIRFISALLVAKIGSRYLTGGVASTITLTTTCVQEQPIPNWAITAGYAAAIGGITRNLAVDLKPVRVNAVAPGLVDTEMWDGLPADAREGLYAGHAAKYVTGRVTGPDNIAEAYMYLMKDHNITGRIIGTDSGSLLV